MSYRVTHLWSVLENDERSLRWLARKSGFSRNYLSQLKHGRRTSVSDDFARRVAAALNLPVDALFVDISPPAETEVAAD